MKVLFIASGNSSDFSTSPFIKSQGETLKEVGVDISYYPIKGKGISGYLKNAKELRQYLKKNKFDILHAHYTLSAWSVVLSFSRLPKVLSLMGTDTYGRYIGKNKIASSSRYLILLTKLIQPFVTKIICKSDHIKSFVYLKKKAIVIPNGVSLEKFSDDDKKYHEDLGLNPDKQYVLFLGSKNNVRKNFRLVEESMKSIASENIELISPYPVTHENVAKYLKTVDVLVVPSFMEGSPNVVKEAMACNCPVVATPVGDIEWLLGDTEGHFVSGFEADNVRDSIVKALKYSKETGRTKGRERLESLELDSKSVASRIKNIYEEILSK